MYVHSHECDAVWFFFASFTVGVKKCMKNVDKVHEVRRNNMTGLLILYLRAWEFLDDVVFRSSQRMIYMLCL